MQFKTATLDGKRIAYAETTTFLIQIGFKRSSYTTRYTITGNLPQAVAYYNAINIGRGYKKRLVAPDFKVPLLARQMS